MKRRRLRRLAAAVTALLVLAMLWWGNNSLSTEEYTYTSERLPDGWDGARIVVLTDLHGKQFGTDNVRLLEAVQAAKPDLIAVCGDLADEHSGVDFVPALMRGLVAIAPTYYVSGNHEWAAGLMPALRQIFQQMGVTYLRNTAVTAERGGDTIVLAGIDDPNGYADQKTPEQVAADVYGTYGEPFWLLLAHRNNLFSGEYCRPRRGSDAQRPRTRRHLAPAVVERGALRRARGAVPVVYKRPLPLHGRRYAGRGGVCLARAGGEPPFRAAHFQPPRGGGGHSTESKLTV